MDLQVPSCTLGLSNGTDSRLKSSEYLNRIKYLRVPEIRMPDGVSGWEIAKYLAFLSQLLAHFSRWVSIRILLQQN